ncbi:MAG: prepilin-type N-terminal cleavage/methylation domain-containing protein [Minisyncoccia bacterium]
MFQFSLSQKGDSKGFTLVELLVTAALVALVFGGLMASIQFALKLVSVSKASTGALALANEQLEYIRSLAYADVGTVAGIPDGIIPQNSTSSLNGVTYFERVLVQYVDSPDDGLGGADSNGILADYKEVKVEYSWTGTNGTTTIFLLTDIVPPGIESTVGGGTLIVNVFDAGVLPVAGAEVHIHNDTTTTTIDVSRFTNALGVATFAGAPAAANYEIVVSKPGYSTDQTYTATTSNPSPITSPVAVVESAVSTMNFQIDMLSDLKVRTIGPSTNGLFSDTFDDASKVALLTSTDITTSGDVVLSGGPGAYVAGGHMESVSTTPSVITAWDLVTWNSSVPLNTSLMVQVYSVSGTSTYMLVPDSDLPGNSVGFSSGPLNIAGLSVGTYASLALGATLASSDVATTSQLHDWSLSYIVTEPGISNIPFTFTGSKIIGDGPVYKYQRSHMTGGSGEIQLNDLEWDSYSLSLSTNAYNIANACSGLPYNLNPGVNETLTLTLVPAVAESLRVTVVDIDGDPIIGAVVNLSRPGVNETLNTSSCGQVFFNSGLISALDYIIDVQATGYTGQNITDITIDSADVLVVTLNVL